MSKRWVWIYRAKPAPNSWDRLTVMAWNDMESMIDGMVIAEAPKGIGMEVRLATLQETGLWTLRALPPATD